MFHSRHFHIAELEINSQASILRASRNCLSNQLASNLTCIPDMLTPIITINLGQINDCVSHINFAPHTNVASTETEAIKSSIYSFPHSEANVSLAVTVLN
ncbi:hypothetical protein D5086_010060 [Populus alba]|uniref:Uncharacterized protein n=1 Tax=Populus alba TaxID=43335 RepID=A0ACC4CA82_POPAL